jgi:diacylglycerol O-acyltransferase / wax synthase
VVVLHHVLADGVGGLGVLAGLVDQAPSPPEVAFPRPRPPVLLLAVDATRDKWRGLRRGIETLRLLRISTAASGGLRPAPAPRCSLIHRAGTRVRLDVVSADHAALRSAAHSHGATVNDALLVTVSRALHRVLLDRGESLDSFAIAIPVSIRAADSPAFGNMVSPALVSVPAVGPPADRLRQVHCEMPARKATAPPPIALLGCLFDPSPHWADIAGTWAISVGSIRSSAMCEALSNRSISAATRSRLPYRSLSAGWETWTVYFEVLSYVGTLTVTAISDPDHFPDPQNLTAALGDEFGFVTSSTTSSSPASKGAGASSRQAPIH